MLSCVWWSVLPKKYFLICNLLRPFCVFPEQSTNHRNVSFLPNDLATKRCQTDSDIPASMWLYWGYFNETVNDSLSLCDCMATAVDEFHCRWLPMNKIFFVSEIIFTFKEYRQWNVSPSVFNGRQTWIAEANRQTVVSWLIYVKVKEV